MCYEEIAKGLRIEARTLTDTAAQLNRLADELEHQQASASTQGSNPEAGKKVLLSVAEAAEALGVSRPTLYKLIRIDDFPSVRIGSRTLINARKLQDWADRQCEEVW